MQTSILLLMTAGSLLAAERFPLDADRFGTLGAPGMDRFAGAGPEAETLSARMVQAWADLAHGRDPEGWPRYDTRSRETLVLDADTRVEGDPRGPERAIWAGF